MSGASNFVEGVDLSFAIILGASIFFLITITINHQYIKVAIVCFMPVSNEIIPSVHGVNTIAIDLERKAL